MQTTHHPIRGYLYIAAATLCWGASATLGKAAFLGQLASQGEGLSKLDPLILAQTRTSISFLLLLPFVIFLRGRTGLAIPKPDILRCMMLGVLGFAASNYFYYYAIEKTTVSTAIVLQYVAPVWVLLYMVARGLQCATAPRVLAVALAFAGSALAIGAVSLSLGWPLVRLTGMKFDAAGVVAAELAAISFAFYNIYGRSLMGKHERLQILSYSLMGATLFWLFIHPPWKIAAAHYSGGQWLFLFVFAITSVLAPFSFYFAGLKHLDPTRAIVTSSLEPVFAILFAVMFVHESLGWGRMAGIAIVLSATIIVQMPGKAAAAKLQHASIPG